MSRLVSVQPRQNPYRENPSGLVIGGVIAALAAAGGAGWYFMRPGRYYDTEMFATLEKDQQDFVKGAYAKESADVAKPKRDGLMKNMLNPAVKRYDAATDTWSEVGRVTPAEAKAMVAAGTHNFGILTMARGIVFENKVGGTGGGSGEAPKPEAKKPAAKKKGKKK